MKVMFTRTVANMALALFAIGSFLLGSTSIAQARPVTDCPLRNAPFSADSPLVDLLFSSAARNVLEQAAPGRFGSASQQVQDAAAPTFIAILTLRNASRFTGIKPEQIAGIDQQLRKLPITAADKIVRCARYDNEVPRFNLPAGRPRVLLFEKINGFKDGPSVDAAHAAFLALAERKGWAIVSTDKGGAINAAMLRQFDMVIWNNVSGDVLTLSQRRALQRFVEGGGGFAAVHGSAGDPAYFWDWYADSLIGARFKGHPASPHFQKAKIVTNPTHPLALALPSEWRMTDEWYSFKTNPRAAGANILLTLDETTYKPVGPMEQDLRMGSDHPIAWTNCVGRGRIFYSAIGHMPETYSHPQNVALLEAALGWVIDRRSSCQKPSVP